MRNRRDSIPSSSNSLSYAHTNRNRDRFAHCPTRELSNAGTHADHPTCIEPHTSFTPYFETSPNRTIRTYTFHYPQIHAHSQ